MKKLYFSQIAENTENINTENIEAQPPSKKEKRKKKNDEPEKIRKIRIPKEDFFKKFSTPLEEFKNNFKKNFNYHALFDAIVNIASSRKEINNNLKKKNTFLFLKKSIVEYDEIITMLFKALKEIELTHKKDFDPKYIKQLSYTIKQYNEILFYIEETIYKALIDVFGTKPPKKENKSLLNMEYIKNIFDQSIATQGEYVAWRKKYNPDMYATKPEQQQ